MMGLFNGQVFMYQSWGLKINLFTFKSLNNTNKIDELNKLYNTIYNNY